MNCSNNVTLKGNLTRDPEIRQINAGGRETQVANFTIAVNRHFKRADGARDKETTYVDCEAWDTGANTLGQYFHRGDPILIQGALKLDTWEADGQKRSKLKVRVNNFERLYRAPAEEREGGETNEQPRQETAAATTADSGAAGDDIPF